MVRYLLSSDVEKHCSEHDLWVVHSGAVYDLTRWYQDHKSSKFQNILRLAGQDITNDVPLQEDWKGCRIGLVSKTRTVDILNMLTGQKDTLLVADEEPLRDILQRYLPFNAHAASYTWKFLGKPLDMDSCLAANGIVFDEDTDEDFVPVIHLFYNDDLTVL